MRITFTLATLFLAVIGSWLVGVATFGGDPARAADPGSYQLVFTGIHSGSGQTLYIENASDDPATVKVDWYDLAGSQVSGASQAPVTIGRNGLVTATVSSSAQPNFLPPGFLGSAVVTSTRPIVGWQSNVATVGGRTSREGRNGFRVLPDSTGSVVSLPYVARDLEGTYNTSIFISNAGARQACVQIDYTFVPGAGTTPPGGRSPVSDKGPGGSGCTNGYPIAPFGGLVISPAAGAGVTPFPSGTGNALMAATITATGSPIVATVEAYLANSASKIASYDGFTVSTSPSPGQASDLGTDIAIPLALKTADGFYSQILLSNPNASTANARIRYVGGGKTYEVSLTIPAKGVANHSVYSDAVVPVGFVGAATVSSDQPLAAVLFRSKMTTAGSYLDEDLYPAVNGVPSANGAKYLFMPSVFRRIQRSSGGDGINSWVSVTVVGGGSANLTIETQSTGAPGCPASGSYLTNRTVQGSFVFYQNADSANGLGANLNCLFGAMRITSDVPILAVAAIIDANLSGDQDAAFNLLPALPGTTFGPIPTPSSIPQTPTPTSTPTPTPTASPTPGIDPSTFTLVDRFTTDWGIYAPGFSYSSKFPPDCLTFSCNYPKDSNNTFLVVTLTLQSGGVGTSLSAIRDIIDKAMKGSIVIGNDGKQVTPSIVSASSNSSQIITSFQFAFVIPKGLSGYRFYWLNQYVIQP